MLASRFPYVTPSGVIGPCGKWPRQQFVDGGYVENTGISTIIDLSPVVARAGPPAQRPRAAAARARSSSIVPFVVYLDNGTGSDLAAPTYENTSEFLVPPLTILRSFDGQADTAALLQQAASLVDADRLWNPKPVARRGWLPTALTRRADDVATATGDRGSSADGAGGDRPAGLDVVRSEHRHHGSVPGPAESSWTARRSSDLLCRRGYGSLADANRLFTG